MFPTDAWCKVLHRPRQYWFLGIALFIEKFSLLVRCVAYSNKLFKMCRKSYLAHQQSFKLSDLS